MEDTTQEQKRMERGAFERLADAYKTFNDIMTGPNPLTKAEIQALCAKRPVWDCLFHNWK
jgi:hypothetical protein